MARPEKKAASAKTGSRSRTRLPASGRSLAVRLVEALEARIQEGVYHPGEKLPTESSVMAEFGVSRTVVREAVSRLQQARLIVTRHGIGSFVVDALPSSEGFKLAPTERAALVDILHILELRVSLETECAGLSAQRRSPRQLRAMRSAIADFGACATSGESAVEADFRFHLSIAEATQNPHFFELLRHLGDALIPRARVNSAQLVHEEKGAYLERVNREHQSILDAIDRQDPEAARAAMRVHLSHSRERLRQAAEAL